MSWPGVRQGAPQTTASFGLSERRAEVATKFFYEKWMSQGKMIAVGMEKAKSARADPMDAVNRRVDVRIEL
jgi:outer membrane protein OmpA-like peptidoglycan-associated protein